MLKNYFRIACRNLWKHKFYTALNIFGLSLGMAGGLVLFQFISFHLSYDRYHRKAGQLYRAVTDLHLPDGTVVHEQGTPLGLTAALQNELPQIKDQAVLLKVHSLTVGVSRANQWKFFAEQENIAFTDQHWFNLFDYTWKEGNATTSLNEPNTAVITQKLADKYFGKEEPVGQTIRLDNKYNVRITGILKDYPANTDTKIDLFLSRPSFRIIYPDAEANMNRYWGAINSTTCSFVWLPDGAGIPEKKIEDAMTRLAKAHFEADMAPVYHFHLQALKDRHFDARYGGVIQRPLLTTLAIVGLFLIIIACFNFINLATAQSARRAKEIGTRKVLGSTTAAIFWQFMTETACIVVMAAVLSFVWIRLALPVLNDWLRLRLSFNFFQDPGLLLCLLLLIALVIAAAGSYPALILSRWKPVDALKKQITSTRSVVFRKGLILIQNVVVQVLIISTFIITLQIRHLKTTDPGFNKESVLMVPIPDPDRNKLSLLEDQLKRYPEIKSLSFCFRSPLSEKFIGGSVTYDERAWENFSVTSLVGDAGYLNTFQLPLLAGRNLQKSDTVREFLVNETLVHKLGIRDPQQVIGHRLVAGALDNHPGTIVGVVKDFNIHALYTPIEPALITTQWNYYQYAAIKSNSGDQAKSLQIIQKAWQSIYPENVFEYHYLNEQINELYHKEALLNRLINTTAAIAIIISCLGLLGLISFFAIQRTKEIGIRKVLGADVIAIVYMLSKDFLKLALLSIVIASPLAWYFMNRWLQDFAYRIPINWWIFALAGVASVLIAMITVSYQAVRAAIANPVESLRTD